MTIRHNRLLAAATLLVAAIPAVAGPSMASAVAGCATSGPGTGAYNVTLCITAPVSGSAISGDTAAAVTATVTGSNPGIRRMTFRLDGDYLITDYQSPYTFVLPSTRWVDGIHSLAVSASMRDGFLTKDATIDLQFANGVTSPPVNTASFTVRTGTAPPADSPFVVGLVGDGASGEASSAAVSDLLTSWNPNMFLYLGDVYEKGTSTEYLNWYGPEGNSFGRLRSITNPAIGNHEYEHGLASGYFDYWDNVPHYYSYDVAGWHIVALDSTSEFSQDDPSSEQYQWLAADLTASAAPCTLVYFHHPRWNVGQEGETPRLDNIWKLMADSGVDLVLNGHDHSYQRWQPLDRDGVPDPTGMTEFVVGLGGHGIQQLLNTDSRLAASVDSMGTFGALRLELNSSGAAYRLGSTAGATLDAGSIRCRGLGPDTAAPAAPVRLTASAPGPQQVQLRWTAPIDDTGVVGYQVLRNGVALAEVGAAPSFDDTSVSPGANYSYQVRAIDAAGHVSELSAPVAVSPPFGQPSVFADDFEAGNLSRWSGSILMTAQRDLVESGQWAARATTTSLAAWAWRQLPAAQNELYYRVRFHVVSHAGNTYLVKLRGAAGTSLLGVYVTSNGKLALRNDVTPAAVNSTTTVTSGEWHELQIHVKIDGASSVVETWLDRTPVSALNRTLDLGTSAIGRLQIGDNSGARAFDVAFDSVLADTAFIADTEPPTVPTALTATATATTATLDWSPASDDTAVAGYGIYRDGQHLADVPADAPTFVDTGLNPETAFEYTVDAVDAAGNRSAQSASVVVSTADDTTPPTVPDNLRLQVVAPTEVDIVWDGATDDVGVSGYNVYRDGQLLDTVEVADAVDSSVAPFQTYVYEVTAIDLSGNESPRSAPLNVTTPDLSPPSVPPGVTATALGASAVRVSWSASTDDAGVNAYEIARDGVVVATVSAAAELRFDDAGRQPSTTYSYAVRAIDLSGNQSDFSDLVAATTPEDTTPPDAPGTLTATVAGGQVQLSWPAAADDIGVTGYRLLRDGSPLADATGTEYVDSTVAEQTSYAYEVQAVDAAGNVSAPSAAAVVTMPPTFLFADGFEANDLAQWSASTGATVQNSNAASGSYAVQFLATGSAAAWAYRQLPAPASDVYYRIRFQVDSTNANVYLLKVRGPTGNSLLGVYVTAAGKLAYRNDVTATSVSSTTLVSFGAWHELQIHVVGGLTGHVDTWLDGTPVAVLSRTENLGTTPVGRVQIGDNSGSRTYNLYVDDVAVDDRLIVV